MKLLRLIKENEHWNDILRERNVVTRFGGGEYSGLAIFNYDIMADFTDEIVRECRGVIVDLINGVVVCRPFDKFCNYGEKGADNIDWRSAKVQDKIDGSIMKVWYWSGKWRISTNKTINAFVAPLGDNGNFGDKFLEAAENVGLDFDALNIAYTYIFELVSPENRVVIDYIETTWWHLGTRNNLTGEEVYRYIGVQQPNEYPITSIKECIEAAKNLNVTGELVEKEGFVVVDANWHRIKVKSPDYVVVHHILPNGGITDEKIFENIRNGEIEEILVYVPSLKERIQKMREKMELFEEKVITYIADCRKEVAEIPQGFNTRKIFALAHRTDPLFSIAVKVIFDGKGVSFDKMPDKRYFSLMEKTVKM